MNIRTYYTLARLSYLIAIISAIATTFAAAYLNINLNYVLWSSLPFGLGWFFTAAARRRELDAYHGW